MDVREQHDGFRRWSYGADLERDPRHYNDLDRSVREYHLAFQPHCKADAIVQIAGPVGPSP
jgi:hypothetical protein